MKPYSFLGITSDKMRKVYSDDHPMNVIGYIDAYGAIHARVQEDNYQSLIHTNVERLSGHCWRWRIWKQEWGDTFTQNLTDEEIIIVTDWLEKNGWKEIDDSS